MNWLDELGRRVPVGKRRSPVAGMSVRLRIVGHTGESRISANFAPVKSASVRLPILSAASAAGASNIKVVGVADFAPG